MDIGFKFFFVIRQPSRIPSRQIRVIHCSVRGDGLDTETDIVRQILEQGKNLGLCNIQVFAQEVAITDAGEVTPFSVGGDVRYLILFCRQ